jgi:hypothetical protein
MFMVGDKPTKSNSEELEATLALAKVDQRKLMHDVRVGVLNLEDSHFEQYLRKIGS